MYHLRMLRSCGIFMVCAILAVYGSADDGSCFAAPKGKIVSLSTKISDNMSNLKFSDVYPHDKYTKPVEHSLQYTKAVISKHAPIFEGTAVVKNEFKTISLQDYLGKYVVFFFYPLDFTFVCPTEILAFSDRIEEFRKINTEVIGVSVDSHFTHLSWIKTPRKVKIMSAVCLIICLF